MRSPTESYHMEQAGLKSEEIFYQVLIKLGVERVDQSQVGKELESDRPVWARATEQQDTEEGIDFFIYAANTWIPVDLTTTISKEIKEKKQEKERKRGIQMLNIRAHVLRHANLGSVKDLQIVADSVTSAVTRALEQHNKKTISEKAVN